LTSKLLFKRRYYVYIGFYNFFIFLYGIGCFVVKAQWKLRYLVPIWVLSFFIITLFVVAILFPKDWTNAQFLL